VVEATPGATRHAAGLALDLDFLRSYGHGMRALIVASVLSSTTIAYAGTDDVFTGWSTDGSYYVVKADTCGGTISRFCKTTGKTPTWPAKLGALPADEECLDGMTQQAIADLDDAAIKKLAPVAGTKTPAGINVTLAAKKVKTADDPDGDSQAIITVKRGARSWTFTVHDVPKATLGPVTWRPDKKAFAVSVGNEHRSNCELTTFHTVDVFEIDLGGDRTASQAANVRGMAAYKKKDYAAANTAFLDAIKLDDSNIWPRYNHASTTSIVGDLAVVRAELAWLKKSTDPDAPNLLKKGLDGDPDLDFASTDPEVRKLLGAPAYPTDEMKRLTERSSGVWSSEADGCEKPTAMLKLSSQKKGVDWPMEVTVFICNAKPKIGKSSYNPSLQLYFNGQYPSLGDQVQVVWTRCPGSDVDGSCFTANGRMFHRGVPHVPAK